MFVISRAAVAAVLALLACAAPAAAENLLSGSRFSGDLTVLSATTYVVNSTANLADATVGNGICETSPGSGICTLRAAVQESNSSIGDFDTINFDIPGAAPHTISNPAVPTLTDPVAIDATTEPGFAGAPVIELKGVGGAGAGAAFGISAGNSLIRGFVMNRFNFPVSIGTAGGNAIEGNYIGTDIAGTTASGLSNYQSGVLVQSSNNTIGGTTAAARNVISGNGSSGVGHGVLITGAGVTGNVVAGNYIGLNAAGTGPIGNNGNGVQIAAGASGNTIGGDTGTTPGGPCTGSCNVISSNGSDGVAPGSGNVVEGNFIGLDPTGVTPRGNTGDGVAIGGLNNVVGGTTPQARNVISGHGFANVHIENASTPTTGNIVEGNYIGTDPTGTIDRSPLGNYGIVVDGQNTIGGTTGTTPGGACTGACNLISGNGSHGIAIVRRSGPAIEGNFIGLNAAGTAALGNGGDGINTFIGGNTIGGTTPAGRNVIAGNGSNGVELATASNVLRGDYVGFSSDGLARIPNGTWAVDVVGANTIGGTNGVTPGGGCTGDCNLILSMVVRSSGTTVQGNFIDGVRPDGLGAASGSGGTLQIANTTNVQVGGDTPAQRNVISGGSNGVHLLSASARVQGNYIGVGTDGTTPVPNTVSGVLIAAGSSGALIGGTGSGEGNVIAGNGADGVWVDCRGAAVNNFHRITGNTIYANGGLGIDLCVDGVSPNDAGDPDTLPPNDGQNFPVLSSASVGSGGAIVNGSLNSRPNMTYTIDSYSSDTCDTSGFGEGKHLIGSASVTTDGSGNASFNQSFPTPPNGELVITTTATSPGNATSEFSKCLSYARPKGAGPVYASLVPAYQPCASPNRTHAAPWDHQSCAPPARTSSYLTVGTPDANLRAANMTGSVKYTVLPGDPATTADEANVQIAADVTDVRRASDLADYTGELLVRSSIRITDKASGAAVSEDATMVDYDLAFPVPCAATGDTAIGSQCAVTTTADAILGSSVGVRETKRTVWGMGQVRVYDGGADNLASTTGDNTLFAVQGIFVP